MNKLNSVDLWLIKKAVECKMENLMDIIKETDSEKIIELYGYYATLSTKLSIIENEYFKE